MKKNAIILVPLFIILFLDALGGSMIGPLIKSLFYSTNGLLTSVFSEATRNTYYGVSLSIYFFASFFGAPILGRLSDQFGRKNLLLISLMGSAIGYLLSIIAIYQHNIDWFIIGRLMDGFTAGNFVIAQAAIIDISTQKNKAIHMGYILLAICLGYTLGPLLSGLLSDTDLLPYFTVTTPFILVTVLSIVNIAAVMFSFLETQKNVGSIHTEYNHHLSLIKRLFSHKILRSYLLIFTLMQLGWAIYTQYIFVYLIKQFNFTNLEISYYSALMGVGLSLSMAVLLKKLISKIPLKHIALGAIISMTVFTVLIDLSTAPIYIWFAVIPNSIAIGIGYPVLNTLISNHTPTDQQGAIMGITGAISALAFGSGSLIGGIFTNIDITLPLDLSILLLIICAIVSTRLIQLKPTKKKAETIS